jgi:putative OmpL-like beta-barrel porin-2
MNMKRLGVFVLVGAVTCVTLRTRAQAQEVIDDIKKEVDTLTKKAVDINFLVATDFFYNFQTPDDRQVPYTVFETREEQFLLNDAFLQFKRMHDDESWGFVINMDFGQTAKVAGATDVDVTSGQSDFALREAYGVWKPPIDWLPGFNVKAGKFVTLLGYEVLKTPDNINFNITNSTLFGYAIPFTHVGALADAPLGDYFTVDLGLTNGWDNFTDGNGAVTFLGGLGIKPMDILSIYVAGTYGSDNTPGIPAGALRGVITGNAALKATDQLTFVLDTVWGTEAEIGRNGTSALWNGIAGYINFDLGDVAPVSFAFRTEVFNDPDGVRNFTNKTGDPVPLTQWEITPTVTWKPTDHIVLRAEYRHDEGDKNVFPINNRDLTAMQAIPSSTIGIAGNDLIGAEFVFLF